MHEVTVSEVGTFQVTHMIQLTDEQWADAVDPTSGLVVDVGLIADEVFRQREGGDLCAHCAGWDKKFSMSLGDETAIIEVGNVTSGEVIYDRDYSDESTDDDDDDDEAQK